MKVNSASFGVSSLSYIPLCNVRPTSPVGLYKSTANYLQKELTISFSFLLEKTALILIAQRKNRCVFHLYIVLKEF
jgi:hypothetical protein